VSEGALKLEEKREWARVWREVRKWANLPLSLT